MMVGTGSDIGYVFIWYEFPAVRLGFLCDWRNLKFDEYVLLSISQAELYYIHSLRIPAHIILGLCRLH